MSRRVRAAVVAFAGGCLLGCTLLASLDDHGSDAGAPDASTADAAPPGDGPAADAPARDADVTCAGKPCVPESIATIGALSTNLALDGDNVFFGEEKVYKRVGKAGGAPVVLRDIVKPLSRATSVVADDGGAFFPADNQIFFVAPATTTAVPLDADLCGTATALDPTAAWFTDECSGGRIIVVVRGGLATGVPPVANGGPPGTMLRPGITSLGGAVYWSGHVPADAGTIETMRKDFTGRQTAVQAQFEATSLVSDDRTLYWITGGLTADKGSVMAFDTTQGAPHALASDLPAPRALAVDARGVYVACMGTAPDYRDGFVARIAKTGGAIAKIAAGRARPAAIAVDAKTIFWAERGPVDGGDIGSIWRVPLPD